MDSLVDTDYINLENYMEVIVFNLIDDLMAKCDCCKCEICRMDIAAYALNHLQPKYVVTRKGEVYSKVNELLYYQYNTDITLAILDAIKVVSANPRHHNKKI